jgi:carbamoyltransferase
MPPRNPDRFNTSFNIKVEPIVCSPEDAFNCLMGTDIEFLVVENCVMRKEKQNSNLLRDYKNAYELDEV